MEVTLQSLHSQCFFIRNGLLAMRKITGSLLRMKHYHSQNGKGDLIGPPHPVSNLRPVIFNVPEDEAPIETKFRLRREEVQKWNEIFWSQHNAKFYKERKLFIQGKLSTLSPSTEMDQLTADEMSVFYKKFLDETWKTHLKYNFEWYGKNVELLLLALRVAIHKARKRIFS